MRSNTCTSVCTSTGSSIEPGVLSRINIWPRVKTERDLACGTFQEAGFDRPRARDAAPFFGDNPIIGPGCRTFYLAHKKLLPG